MLLYIHTQTTTYIYRTSKTNRQANSKMLTAWHFSLTHTSPKLCGAMPLSCSHHRISLHRLLTRERQNVKMLAKKQLVSYSCFFFFSC